MICYETKQNHFDLKYLAVKRLQGLIWYKPKPNQFVDNYIQLCHNFYLTWVPNSYYHSGSELWRDPRFCLDCQNMNLTIRNSLESERVHLFILIYLFIFVFNWNHFEMRLLNQRIIFFLFIADFGSFVCLFFF